MMNSLCGSSLSLKNENSRNKLQPTSSNDTNIPSKKNTTQSCDNLEQISILTPQSLNLPSLKFDLDGDVEIPSPDSSMWETFFNDHLDNDFMISSPIRNINPNSPQQASTYNSNYNNYSQGMQIYSPPRFASQSGGLNSNYQQKGKGLSPLHRVFNSPNNQYMQHVENLSLPAIEEFLEDYQTSDDQGLGYSSTKISNSECFDMQTPISTILDSLTMQNSSSSRYCGSINEESSIVHGGNSSQVLSQESDIYHQMGSMASASLSQALQQERYQEKHQKMQAQQQSLTVPIPIGIEQVIKSFICPVSPKSLI